MPAKTRVYAGAFGLGLGIIALPKTIYKLISTPNPTIAIYEIQLNYILSDIGVTNAPDKK